MDGEIRPELQALRERLERTLDDARDEARVNRLRDRAGIVEVMAAGTFMIDGPARCSWEVEAK